MSSGASSIRHRKGGEPEDPLFSIIDRTIFQINKYWTSIKENNGNYESSHAMELAFSKFQNKKRSELISLIENLEDIQDTDIDCRKNNSIFNFPYFN